MTKTRIQLRTFLLYLLVWISLSFCQSQANQLSHPAHDSSVCQLFKTKVKQRLIFLPNFIPNSEYLLGNNFYV